jgi:hypothetical protein
MLKRVVLIVGFFAILGVTVAGPAAPGRAEVYCTEWEEDEDGEYCVCWADDVSMREWCE